MLAKHSPLFVLKMVFPLRIPALSAYFHKGKPDFISAFDFPRAENRVKRKLAFKHS